MIKPDSDVGRRDEGRVRAVNGLGDGVHALSHEVFAVGRDRIPEQALHRVTKPNRSVQLDWTDRSRLAYLAIQLGRYVVGLDDQ